MTNINLPQCPAIESTGFGPQMILGLTQSLWAAQLICSLSPPDMWPKDYGETASEKGIPLKYDSVNCTTIPLFSL